MLSRPDRNEDGTSMPTPAVALSVGPLFNFIWNPEHVPRIGGVVDGTLGQDAVERRNNPFGVEEARQLTGTGTTGELAFA